MSTKPSWHVSGAAHTGASHSAHRIPCQDYIRNTIHHAHDERHPSVIATIADGAGSSPHAGRAAQIATMAAITSAQFSCDLLSRPANTTSIRQALALAFQNAHQALSNTAQIDQNPVSDYQTTLLMFIQSDDILGTAQIGDGAIVGITANEPDYRLLTKPQQGRYNNETRFITDSNYEQHSQYIAQQDPHWSAVAMFSDGLQRLLLNYDDPDQPVPHQPFFQKTFRWFATCPQSYEAFLNIHSMLRRIADNRRSHDDLSLVIAATTNRSQ